ncbi:MAG: universal stress protein [Bacteroidota bacterium]
MKKILIPCDFSDTSESALKYAVAFAKYFSADMVLLHVEMVPVVSPEMNITPYAFGDMREDSLNALKNLSDKIKITEAFNGRIDYFSEMGHTPDIITEQVEKLNIDLVIMGISGHGSSFMKNLVGSASVDVSKKITAPLIIVPPGTVFKKVQNVAYACDYNPELILSTSLLTVKYLSTAFNAMLNIVHVVPENHELTAEEAGLDNYIERKLENSEHRTFIVNEKNTAHGILSFITQHNIDMIIIEPKKHSLFHKLFSGSTTNQIAFNSPVPVLTIHGETVGEA